MAELFNAGKVRITVSARELKYKSGDVVKVNKFNKETGHNEPTATMVYQDIDDMKEYLSQEEIEILAVANHTVRCQNIARNWDKPKASKIDSGIANALKGKELTEEQKAKVIAYLSKI